MAIGYYVHPLKGTPSIKTQVGLETQKYFYFMWLCQSVTVYITEVLFVFGFEFGLLRVQPCSLFTIEEQKKACL